MKEKQVMFLSSYSAKKKLEELTKTQRLVPVEQQGNSYVIATGKKGKNIGYIDGFDMLKRLEEVYPEKIVDVDFDRDLFLVFFTSQLYEIRYYVTEFEKIYKEQPERFYKLAIRSRYYNHIVINDGNIMLDIALKRIYGVLLGGESDIELQKRIEHIFFCYDEKLKEQIDAASPILIDRLEDKEYRYSAVSVYVFAYLLLNRFEITDNFVVNFIAKNASDLTTICDKRGFGTDSKQRVDSGFDPFSKITFKSDYVWKMLREILAESDISSITTTLEYDLGTRHDGPKNERIGKLIRDCPKSDPCYKQITDAMTMIYTYGYNGSLVKTTSSKKFVNHSVLNGCGVFAAGGRA